MLFVANYTMKGPAQAWIATLLLSLLTVFFSPFGILLGAVISLIALRIGVTEGVKTAIMAIAILLGLNVMVNQSMWPGIVGIAEFVVPVIFMAILLRNTNDLAKVLVVAMGITGVSVVLFFLAVGDATLWWQNLLNHVLVPMLAEAGVQQDISASVDQVADILTLLLAMTAVVLWFSIILIARWWQGTIYYPGQFKQDYYQLRLPMKVAVLAVVVSIAGILSDLDMLHSLSAVLMAGFMFQGLAISHHAVETKGMRQGWLIGIYVLMFLFPQTILILATIGLMDTWMDVRNRWTNE